MLLPVMLLLLMLLLALPNSAGVRLQLWTEL